jgi:hypothetical protein
VSLFGTPREYDGRIHRRVRLGLILWAAGFFGLMVVPLLLNGWDSPGLFADAVWRNTFGAYLLVSGFATLTFCRTLAEFHRRRDEVSLEARVVRKAFFWAQLGPMSFVGHLLGQFLTALMLVSFGLSLCTNRFPHPKW